jgi:hypothetical protein
MPAIMSPMPDQLSSQAWSRRSCVDLRAHSPPAASAVSVKAGMRRDDGSESSNAHPLLGAGLPRSERDSQHHPTGVPAVQAEARDVVELAAARGCCARVCSRPRPPSGRSTSSCETPTPRCSSSTTSSTCHGSSRGRCASTYARSILRRCAASLGLHQGGPRRPLYRPPRRRCHAVSRGGQP